MCFLATTLLAALVIATPSSEAASGWNKLGPDVDGEALDDLFGETVTLSGDGQTLVVGSFRNDRGGRNAGYVRVYRWNGNSWVQRGQSLIGEASNDLSGWSVAVDHDGETVAIGAPYNDQPTTDAGHVRTYRWDGRRWARRGPDLDGPVGGSRYGYAIDLSNDGDTMVVGAPYNGTTASGIVAIYDWNGSRWANRGPAIHGDAIGDSAGWSVAISADGNTVALGAPWNDNPTNRAGHVRVHRWDGRTWAQHGPDREGPVGGRLFGYTVDISADGNTIAVGAPYNGGGVGESAWGLVAVYDLYAGRWANRGSALAGEAAGDLSGWSISLSADGDTIAIGTPRNDRYGPQSGFTRVYEWGGRGRDWRQVGGDFTSEADRYGLGYAVSLSADGKRAAIGAPFNDALGRRDAGHVQVWSRGTDPDPDPDPDPETDPFPRPGGTEEATLSVLGQRVCAGGPQRAGALFDADRSAVINGADFDTSAIDPSLDYPAERRSIQGGTVYEGGRRFPFTGSPHTDNTQSNLIVAALGESCGQSAGVAVAAYFTVDGSNIRLLNVKVIDFLGQAEYQANRIDARNLRFDGGRVRGRVQATMNGFYPTFPFNPQAELDFEFNLKVTDR